MVAVEFPKNFTGLPFYCGWTTKLQLLVDSSFDRGFQNIVF